jgi:hypothetical protein
MALLAPGITIEVVASFHSIATLDDESRREPDPSFCDIS